MNGEGHVLGLWYYNFKCSSTLVVQLMGIHKAIMASYNFKGKVIQVENNCKVAIEALLGISPIPWKVCVSFSSVKKAYEVGFDVSLLWYTRVYNGAPHEAAKWVANVIKYGSDRPSQMSPTLDIYVLHDITCWLNIIRNK